MSSGLMQTTEETLGRNGRTSKPWILKHENFKSGESTDKWEQNTRKDRNGGRWIARDKWAQHKKRHWRRSWRCLFGNSRWRSPRGMLMRDRPFRGWGGGRGVFSRIAGLGEGGGSLRGQGSELSRDPTTTNAALSFKLLHRQRAELLVKWGSSRASPSTAGTALYQRTKPV